MKTFQQTFTGADTWVIGVGGELFRLLSNDAAEPVDIRFYRGGQVVSEASQVESGFYAKPAGGFDSVRITTTTAQTLKVLVGDGEAGYDRFAVDILSSIGITGSITVLQATAITDAVAINVGVAATQLLAASAARKSARFYNAGSVDVYLGGAGVTTVNGVIKVAPGQMWCETEAAAAAWYGIAGTAGQSVRIQEVS